MRESPNALSQDIEERIANDFIAEQEHARSNNLKLDSGGSNLMHTLNLSQLIAKSRARELDAESWEHAKFLEKMRRERVEPIDNLGGEQVCR